MSSTPRVTIPKPDDFHLHLRDGAVLRDTATAAAKAFQHALIMPNLQPPVVNATMAAEYRQRILAHTQSVSSAFTPLMTLYLTPTTSVADIEEAAKTGFVVACKLYPAGATTHSSQGVPLSHASLQSLSPVFAAMAASGLILCVHSEVTDQDVDVFEREAAFLKDFLPRLIAAHANLRIVVEHITTRDAVDFVRTQGPNIAATITAHHLLVNRNAIFNGGLNPHYYCLPVLKSEDHRRAILEAATSDSDKFFAGTDSAPHARHRKLHEGCAGCYTAFAATELYAQAFDSVNALDRLNDFCCQRGRKFYGLKGDEAAREQITLVRDENGLSVPLTLPFGEDEVVPFMAGKTIQWKIEASH